MNQFLSTTFNKGCNWKAMLHLKQKQKYTQIILPKIFSIYIRSDITNHNRQCLAILREDQSPFCMYEVLLDIMNDTIIRNYKNIAFSIQKCVKLQNEL